VSKTPEPGWAFKMMALIHDNPIRRILSNPYNTLKAAGLKHGQIVLEVGCGPGFFTIPAAKTVTDTGMVYALDIHPLAIKRVQEKITKEKITNVKTIHKSTTETGLPDQSIDLVFLFGIIHRIDEVFKVILKELYRILRVDGILSIQKSRFSEKLLINTLESKGFSYKGYKKRIFLFRKKK